MTLVIILLCALDNECYNNFFFVKR